MELPDDRDLSTLNLQSQSPSHSIKSQIVSKLRGEAGVAESRTARTGGRRDDTAAA